nr:MAG TPA: tail protein [Caudoviricetes sp.]
MHQVYCDGQLLHDPRLQEYQLLSPSLSLELNKTGTFTFTMYPDHPGYGVISKLKSIITIEKNGAVLFRGRPLSSKEGFYKQLDYTCEGELAFLLDSRVRPFEMAGEVMELFTYLINQHNEQVDETKRFQVGTVTVTDPNDYVNRSNITYETTWDILNTRLLNTLGGYLWVRHEADGVYLDYLADFPYMSTQRITFGENLLDYARTRDGSEIATALIPLGARLTDADGKQTEERLTISDVNDGKDYVYDQAAVEQYGWIFTTQNWDDVTQAGNLKQKGLDALREKIKTVDTIEMTAADLSQMDKSFDDFRIGQYVFVDSLPHGMDGEKFLVTKMTLNLSDPSQNKLIFGRVKSSFTEETNRDHQTVGDLISRTEAIESDYVTNDTITSITKDVYSRIDQSAEEILSEVGSTYVTSDDFREELSTSLTQTAEGWEMTFNQFRQWVETENGETQTAFEELRKYIRFLDGNIILGDRNNDLQCIITNTKISFEQNGTEVAYISNNKLYITSAEVLDRFTVGNTGSGYFDWIPRANGNLGMKWRAG